MSLSPDRRRFVGLAALGTAGLLPALAGCANPLPLAAVTPAIDDAVAARWLRESAEHHGLARYLALNDINVAYAGRWRPLIDRIQPEVVDKPWRASSEERLLPRQDPGFIAQAHRGPAGRKQVVRQRGRGAGDLGRVAVWYEGQADEREGIRTASALVADCYQLFLLGPLWLAPRVRGLTGAAAGGVAGGVAGGALSGASAHSPAGEARLALGDRIEVEGRECQWVQAWLAPGFGLVGGDRVDLAIDVQDRTTRRMRFTLEGYAGTRGAVAETDTFEHERVGGVLWPMRSFERVVRPLAGLPAHDWRITGLDLDRGYGLAAVQGPVFEGAAAAPARPRTS